MEKFKAVSFFAGAGGLDLGIKKAGFNIVLTNELEPVYCETLKMNEVEKNIVQGNIMTYDKKKIFFESDLDETDEIDLIFGGSPCQSFSTAGKRQAFEDPRGQAMLKFVDIVEEAKPKIFLLENVKGLLSASLKHRPLNQRGKEFPNLMEEEEKGSALEFLLSRLKSYDVKIKVLNSADYGVPQKRQRVFVVGVRKDLKVEYKFPEPTHSNESITDLKKWITVKEVLENLNVGKHTHVNYSENRLKYMKQIPIGGGNWRDLPLEMQKEAMGGAYYSGGGKVGFFRRIKENEPAPTLLTSPIQKSTNLGHYKENRPLSIEEYLAIQGFPNNYKVSGTINQQYTQIGNAVPVELAYKMGCSLREFLNKV